MEKKFGPYHKINQCTKCSWHAVPCLRPMGAALSWTVDHVNSICPECGSSLRSRVGRTVFLYEKKISGLFFKKETIERTFLRIEMKGETQPPISAVIETIPPIEVRPIKTFALKIGG